MSSYGMQEANTAIQNYTSSTVCHDYCCSAFALFQNQPLYELETLSNAIHPIFRRQNSGIDIDYEALEPCLRLATHLLESTALVPFLNTVVDREIRDLDGKAPRQLYEDTLASIWVHSIWPRPGQDQINLKTKRRAQAILRQMVDMVRFEIEPFDPSSTQSSPYG